MRFISSDGAGSSCLGFDMDASERENPARIVPAGRFTYWYGSEIRQAIALCQARVIAMVLTGPPFGLTGIAPDWGRCGTSGSGDCLRIGPE